MATITFILWQKLSITKASNLKSKFLTMLLLHKTPLFKNSIANTHCVSAMSYHSRIAFYSTSTSCAFRKKNTPENPDITKPESSAPKLAIHGLDDKLIGHFTKTEAFKLAREKDVKLVLVQDPEQSDKKYYKFLPGKSLQEDFKKVKASKKDNLNHLKSLILGSRISPHDLQTRIKAITKWLKKNQEVHLTVQLSTNTSDSNVSSQVLDNIEKSIKEFGKVKNKTTKSGAILVVLEPLIKENQEPPAT